MESTGRSDSRRTWLSIALLALLFGCLYLPRIGSYPFWDPWEAHYSQVAMEMKQRGSWFEPWYRQQPRFWSKPILPLLLIRTSFTLFGIRSPADPMVHFAGRLPIILVSLLGIALTWWWTRKLFGTRAGWYSALVLGTCPMYGLLAHQVMFDLPFVVFTSAAVGFYFLARSEKGRPVHLIFFFLLAGLGFLCKWLLAFFIPLGIWLVEIGWRWEAEPFRAIGRRWLTGAGVALSGISAALFAGLPDKEFAALSTVVALGFVLMFLLGRHVAAEKGWKGHWSWSGFVLVLVITLPWHVYMTARHGMPFLREVIVYHHFGRAAGTIGKPEGTFDVYFKQLAFGLYPWVSLLPMALWFLAGRSRKLHLPEQPLHFRLLLAVIVPWTAFSLFQTKFHHYIFPVVPFAAIAIAVLLDNLSTEQPRPLMKLLALTAGAVAAVMLADIRHDYSPFVHLFDYYYSWPLPRQLDPYTHFTVIGSVWLVVMAVTFFKRRIGALGFGAAWLPAAASSVLLTAWIVPSVAPSFSQYSIFKAYQKASGGKAPVGQYNGWLSRSVSFYFGNKAVDLSRGEQPSIDRAIEFLSRTTRTFVILGAGYGRECKQLLAELRPKVKRRLGKSLYVVFDGHPFSCLASTQRDPAGEEKLRRSILKELPAGVHRTSVDFDGKIELAGWRIEPERVERGGEFWVHYYFRCKAPVGDDWLVFIHGDGPQRGAHRIFGDHAPLGGLYPTSEWKPGELIEDRVKMAVPANYPYDHFTLWMGFWKGPKRLPVTQKFMHDGANRVRTAVVRVR
ncbi:MAG: hypothetical protein D6806_05830 [Deltaproteobacteria bacterium]|nr:MAG: hypothetical protein D6806_05830 [Deltaproteobacteria bacterium]